MTPIPEIISPWRLPLAYAHALDAYCENGQDSCAAAKALGVSPLAVRQTVGRARALVCEVGEFVPAELTPSALAALWSAWRKRQWAETLAS